MLTSAVKRDGGPFIRSITGTARYFFIAEVQNIFFTQELKPMNNTANREPMHLQCHTPKRDPCSKVTFLYLPYNNCNYPGEKRTVVLRRSQKVFEVLQQCDMKMTRRN